jgi:hypothetical protein
LCDCHGIVPDDSGIGALLPEAILIEERLKKILYMPHTWWKHRLFYFVSVNYWGIHYARKAIGKNRQDNGIRLHYPRICGDNWGHTIL